MSEYSDRRMGRDGGYAAESRVPMRKRAVGLAFLIGLLVLSGCGSGVYYTITPTDPTAPPPVATQSGSMSVAPQYAAVGTGGSSQFKATVSGSGGVQWLVNGISGGNATVDTVDANGNFTAPAALVQSVNVVVTAELANSAQTNYATAVVSLVASGVVSDTGNPQVASYSINLPVPGSVYVEFGDSAAYGFPTSVQMTPSHNGGQLTVLVAGMRGNTAYHMRAQVVLNDGAALRSLNPLAMSHGGSAMLFILMFFAMPFLAIEPLAKLASRPAKVEFSVSG
jgi:arylsulfate sulfotransferase